MLSPLRENLIRSDTGCERLVMSLTGSVVLRQLVALLGRPLGAPLEFAPSLGIASGYGRSIAEYIKTAARDLEHDDALLHSPLAMSQFEQFIITGLLLSHRHNYSDALARPERSISSRDVKRATDYIQTNLAKVVTLPDIVSAAGVPGRTLFKHFRQFTGMTPMSYLRNARLMRVHDVLLKAPDGASIAAIASSHGFDHLGRFAVEYRKRFGEKPSETYAEGIGQELEVERHIEFCAVAERHERDGWPTAAVVRGPISWWSRDNPGRQASSRLQLASSCNGS